MKGQLSKEKRDKTLFQVTMTAVLALSVASGQALSQVPVDENGRALPVYAGDQFDDAIVEEHEDSAELVLTAVELEELVGPVALYPDDLLAIVLPASTYPLEVVQAARFLEQLETDSSLKPDEEWDESIVALLNYPDVIQMMDNEIDWTWRLGEAVISQQNDLIAAVESFRDRAYAAGNLKSDEHQKVSYDEGTIEIVPVSEEIIYVPYYEPTEVIVRQTRPVYYYYPDPYPVYYYPYPVDYRFRSHYFWGVTTAFTIGWSNHNLHVYHPSYWGHPYYGRYYYGHYYRRPSITVYNNWYVNNRHSNARYRYRDGDHWRPRSRAGSRQNEPRVRNYHYSPNGSNNSRDYTVSRRDRVRAADNGRMALNLRERDSNQVATDSGRRSGAANNRRSSTRDTVPASRTGANSSAANGRRRIEGTTSRSQRSENRQNGANRDIQFRNRNVDAARSTSGSRQTVAGNDRSRRTAATTTSRRTVTPPSQNPGRVAASQRQPARTGSNRTGSNRQVSAAAPSRTSAARTAPPQRISQATSRQQTSAARSTPPPARQSAPPRASAPSSRPATARSNKGDGGAGRNRQDRKPRARPRN